MVHKNDLFRIIDLPTLRNTSYLLNERRKKEEYTDVELQIGDKLFPAHRVVLSLHSPVLEAAISDQWSTTKICPISDEYVDVEIVETLLSFLYTGNIKLTPDNVHPLCMAAHFLQIESLLEPCVEFLCELISVENVLKLFLFSISSQLDVLRNGCLRFIIAHYEKVFQDSEILEFRFEDFKRLILGLKKRFWGTGLREHTFDRIVRWTEKNLPKRLEHLPILLENIPLVELPVEFLEQTVSSNLLVNESVSCAETLTNAITNNETSWKTKDNFIVIGGNENKSEAFSSSVFCYDLHTGASRELPNLNEFNYNSLIFSATVVNGRDIVVSGGSLSTSNYTQRIEMFDWLTQSWTSLPTAPYLLGSHAIGTLKGHLYLAGNIKDESSLSKSAVMSYSFRSKQWKIVVVNRPRMSYKYLISYENHLYALGTHDFDKYDPLCDQWTRLKAPQTNYSHFAATLHQGKIYVCSYAGFEVYDLETNLWSSLPVPPVRPGMALVSVNGKLLSVGGVLVLTDSTSTNLIFEFDFGTQRWNEFGELPAKLSYHRCVVGGFY